MMLRAPGAFKVVSWLALPVSISPKKGAAASVYLASSPQVAAVTGRYFAGGKPADIKSKFNTAPTRRRLWDLGVGCLRERGLLEAQLSVLAGISLGPGISREPGISDG